MEAGQGLIHYDLQLAAWCLANIAPTTVIVDVGCRIGQFAALIDPHRFGRKSATRPKSWRRFWRCCVRKNCQCRSQF
jgi:hypothetical protein